VLYAFESRGFGREIGVVTTSFPLENNYLKLLKEYPRDYVRRGMSLIVGILETTSKTLENITNCKVEP